MDQARGTCKVVVDASGQKACSRTASAARVGSGAEQGRDLDVLRRRLPRRRSGRRRHAGPANSTRTGWFWYIPLHDNRVSVGVVAPFDYLFKDRENHEQTYQEELEHCPAVKERVARANASPVTSRPKDYSYRSKQVAGNGWVLIGDAFGFLDPLYSSGVLLALKSGRTGRRCHRRRSAEGDTSGAQLGNGETVFNEGVDRMRRLVCEYYDGFSFGKFVRKFPDLQGTITDLLIGDLFNDAWTRSGVRWSRSTSPARPPFRPGTRGRRPTRCRTRRTSSSCPRDRARSEARRAP